jgi:hypothetical protein
VSIIICTSFPVLLERGSFFLSEQYNFEHTGQIFLFMLGVYIFDLMIQILYAIDEHLSRIFITQIFVGILICLLAISGTKNMGVSNIYTFLFVGISMAYMKALTLYMSDKNKRVAIKLKNRMVVI